MADKEFNLLEEPWVRVLNPNGKAEEVSLTKALLHAHEYKDLAGETPTQDVAVLRLLLAVLHTVFSRVDETGCPAPFEDEDDALERWGALWQAKRLPEKPICDYLTQWHERFWLFHPEHPFYQVPQAAIGTEYDAPKLNGELLESGNKLRLFSAYAGVGKTELTYAQAARWLLYTNGYDDTSAKPKKLSDEKLPSPGAGWLGKLGLILLMGDNLFETLLLNLVLLEDGKTLWGGENLPCWELEKPRAVQRVEISVPQNAAELLTVQSRRLLLCRQNGKVTGFTLLGGDFFQKENAFAEQMTLWGLVPDRKKDAAPRWQPRRHDPARQIWREFPGILDVKTSDAGKTHQPGVIGWLATLKQAGIYDRRLTRYQIASAVYGDKDFFVNDAFSDTLTFHADLLTEIGRQWQAYIMIEIEKCESAAKLLGRMATELEVAAGGDNSGAAQKARQNFYFSVDMPFRRWLQDIDPNADAAQDSEVIENWRDQVKSLARQQAKEMLQKAGNAAFVGRSIEDKKSKKTYHYSAPEAYNHFLHYLNKLYKTT